MSTDLQVRTYDPKQVIVTFGTIAMMGYAEGTFISIERNGQLFEKSRGSDGSVDRTNKNAFDFSVTLTLKQTSPTNQLLSAVAAADQLSNLGVLPLVIKDLNGATVFTAPQAWIQSDPNDEFGDTSGSREWVFDTGPAAKLTGGN